MTAAAAGGAAAAGLVLVQDAADGGEDILHARIGGERPGPAGSAFRVASGALIGVAHLRILSGAGDRRRSRPSPDQRLRTAL